VTEAEMLSKFIWRIEDGEGTGAYGSSLSENIVDHFSGSRANCPVPWREHHRHPSHLRHATLDMSNKYDRRFGFSTVRQLREWFDKPKILEGWCRNGMRLRVYRRDECGAVFESARQTVFEKPENASRHATIALKHAHGRSISWLMREANKLLKADSLPSQ
jgi:hypothetical protein